MSIDRIVVIDTESTGLKPDEGARLLELAHVSVEMQSGRAAKWAISEGTACFVEHDDEVPPEARAVHHITPEQTAPGAPDCWPLDVLVGDMLRAEADGMCYAAHNATHDRAFLPDLTLPWVCTMRCAMHLYPEAPAYGNQVLRYWMHAEPPAHLVRGLHPHRALYDAATTAVILTMMLRLCSIEKLVALTTTPVLLYRVRFGEHRKKPWHDVPRPYLRWMRDKSDFYRDDGDIKHTVDYWLAA